MNTGVSRSKIFGVGEYPSGTFRFKKIDGSFWNGETFRFADYKSSVFLIFNFAIVVSQVVCLQHENK